MIKAQFAYMGHIFVGFLCSCAPVYMLKDFCRPSEGPQEPDGAYCYNEK